MLDGFTRWSGSFVGAHERTRKLVEFSFTIYHHDTRVGALEDLARRLSLCGIGWMIPVGTATSEWEIDLDAAALAIPGLRQERWAKGSARVFPDIEMTIDSGHKSPIYIAEIRLIITPAELVKVRATAAVPAELAAAMDALYRKQPRLPVKAFVLMPFRDSSPYSEIIAEIRAACAERSIEALRADDCEYLPELLANVRVYLHACDFGIAVFDRIWTDDFNPNVSLEVGYLLALGKPICLLKDATLRALHTDLVGRLYREYDTRNLSTVSKALGAWLQERNFGAPPKEEAD